MFNKQIQNLSPSTDDQEDECDSYNTGQKCYPIINWSPREENKYFSKNRFASPRILSKSVPRRNKTLFRYKINRSLSFDTAYNQHNSMFKSPNTSTDSNYSDGDKQLTRSAKIMKALNVSYTPFHKQTKKIKKSLNFDLSPNPKRFTSVSKSSRSTNRLSLSSPLPTLHKAKTFDTSPTDSNTSSILMTSSESMDENQNRTPSQRSRNIKKTLIYVTSDTPKNAKITDLNYTSPILRTDLKERIDNIIQIDGTPNVCSLQRNKNAFMNLSEMSVRTPRNLFNDFCDEDDRPHTPENMIRIIPQSISAIKKSHKKERLSRGMQHVAVHEIEVLLKKVDSSESVENEKRPSTPPMNAKYISPTCNIKSIKKSHKKGKNKKQKLIHHSEDEFSDSGSIFNYSDHYPDAVEEKRASKEANDISTVKVSLQSTQVFQETQCYQSLMKEGHLQEENDCESLTTIQEPNEYSNKIQERVGSKTETNLSVSSTIVNNKYENRSITPEIREVSNDTPVTPKNNFTYLHHMLTESIKKSHKKVKDENKKKIFRPKNLQNKLKDEKLDSTSEHFLEENILIETKSMLNSEDTNRSITPENVNSSRLLLSQYNSVKKSHKKDKHSKMLFGYTKRKMYFNKEYYSAKDYGRNDANALHKTTLQSNNLSLCITHGNNLRGDISLDDTEKVSYEKHMLELCANDCMLPSKLSPSKRKLLSDEAFQINSLHTLDSSHSSKSSNNVEAEFKIFTPIKKQRSLYRSSSSKSMTEGELNLQLTNYNVTENGLLNTDVTKCVTPISYRNRIEQSEDSDFVILDTKADSDSEYNEINSNSYVQDIPSEKPSGRSTPINSVNVEVLFNVNCIKKSHKKDKRRNTSTRALILNQQDSQMILTKNSIVGEKIENSDLLDNTQLCGKYSEEIDYKNPQPSTSGKSIESHNKESSKQEEIVSGNVTPPNSLQAKNYMKLLKTTSIKRSHKKERDKRKYNLLINSSTLSDDGSLFNEKDGVREMQDCYSGDAEDDNGKVFKNIAKVDSCNASHIASISMSLQSKVHDDKYIHLSYSSEDLSSDGSIFDSPINRKYTNTSDEG